MDAVRHGKRSVMDGHRSGTALIWCIWPQAGSASLLPLLIGANHGENAVFFSVAPQPRRRLYRATSGRRYPLFRISRDPLPKLRHVEFSGFSTGSSKTRCRVVPVDLPELTRSGDPIESSSIRSKRESAIWRLVRLSHGGFAVSPLRPASISGQIQRKRLERGGLRYLRTRLRQPRLTYVLRRAPC